MEANHYGCLSEALTVAAMLSAETALLPVQRWNSFNSEVYVCVCTHTHMLRQRRILAS